MLCQEENMEQLKVEGISKFFDGERVLEDISIALNKGELVSLLGISGGGGTGELYAAEGPAPALPDHRG